MRIRSDVRIHALLGNLYDRLGRHTDAMKHWRLAADVAGALPAGNQPLPPADTRGDPTLVDLGRISASPYSAPIAAAAGIAGTELAGSAESASSRRAASPDSAAGGASDQYFDSAPVPGLDASSGSSPPPRSEAHTPELQSPN